MGIFDKNENAKANECHCHTPRHIKGVVCDVHNCVHHASENCCTADKIAVGPSYATSCSDTVCASFKPKN